MTFINCHIPSKFNKTKQTHQEPKALISKTKPQTENKEHIMNSQNMGNEKKAYKIKFLKIPRKVFRRKRGSEARKLCYESRIRC